MLGNFSKNSIKKNQTKSNATNNLENQIILLSQNGWFLQVYQNLFNK